MFYEAHRQATKLLLEKKQIDFDTIHCLFSQWDVEYDLKRRPKSDVVCRAIARAFHWYLPRGKFIGWDFKPLPDDYVAPARIVLMELVEMVKKAEPRANVVGQNFDSDPTKTVLIQSIAFTGRIQDPPEGCVEWLILKKLHNRKHGEIMKNVKAILIFFVLITCTAFVSSCDTKKQENTNHCTRSDLDMWIPKGKKLEPPQLPALETAETVPFKMAYYFPEDYLGRFCVIREQFFFSNPLITSREKGIYILYKSEKTGSFSNSITFPFLSELLDYRTLNFVIDGELARQYAEHDCRFQIPLTIFFSVESVKINTISYYIARIGHIDIHVWDDMANRGRGRILSTLESSLPETR